MPRKVGVLLSGCGVLDDVELPQRPLDTERIP
jgi:hypothetical protein